MKSVTTYVTQLNRQCLVLVAYCLLLSSAIGCGRDGPETVSVKGTITYDGGPWPKPGSLQFFADASAPNQSLRPAVGHFDTDGRLTVTTFKEGDGLVPGKYGISVISYETPPSNMELTFPKNYTPVRYHSAATSGLKVAVEPGQKTVELNFDVPKE